MTELIMGTILGLAVCVIVFVWIKRTEAGPWDDPRGPL